ncbi:MAG: hypothetical protein ACM3YO_08725 [Bacteroidota bacterium]
MLENCPLCGKVFRRTSNLISCPACQVKEKETFERLRDYFWENRTATLQDVLSATGISEKLVRSFLKGERLKQNSLAQCLECGRHIEGGTLCAACQEKAKPAPAPPTPSPYAGRQRDIEHRLRSERWSDR